MAEQMIGIGMIGLGRWARAHGRAAARSKSVRLVDCYARTAETRTSFSGEFGVDHESGSIEQLLANPAVHAVVVSTPNDLHVEHAIACVNAGKPVLVDKPVAVTAAEGIQLLRKAAATGVAVGVAHHPRRLAGLRAAKRWIGEGSAGTVRLGHGDFSNNRSANMKPDAWHRTARGSDGGVLIQVGIHQVDNLLYLLGPVVSVNARLQHVTLGETIPDLAAVTMQHVNGAISIITSSWTTPGHFVIELLGTGGNFSYRLDHRQWTSGDVDDYGETTVHPTDGDRQPLKTTKGDPLREQLEELGRTVEGASMEVDVAAGLRASLVVEASVRSAAAEGAVVAIAGLLGEAGGTKAEIENIVGTE